MTKEEYDFWRYNYPKPLVGDSFVKIPSQEFSDAMVAAFNDDLKKE